MLPIARHLDLKLEISFKEKSIKGKAILKTFIPNDATRINFHFRQGKILKVLVNGVGCGYFHHSGLDKIVDNHVRDIHAFTDAYKKASIDSRAGELSIVLQEGMAGVAADVYIEYILLEPYSGAIFTPAEHEDQRHSYVYTHSVPEMARCWFPCWDSPAHRFTFTMEIAAPLWSSVFCSGNKISETVYEIADSKVVKYESTFPVAACSIGFVCGKLFSLEDPIASKLMYSCHPKKKGCLLPATFTIGDMFKGVVKYLDCELNCDRVNVVFVPNAVASLLPLYGLVVLSEDMLHDDRSIDQHLTTRFSLMTALCSQYFGAVVTPKTWNDTWLVYSIATQLANMNLLKTVGFHEMKYRLQVDVDRVCDMDIEGVSLHTTLKQQNQHEYVSHPLEQFDLLRQLKGPLVIRILEKKIGSSFFKTTLQGIIKQASKEAGPTPNTTTTANNKDPSECEGRIVSVSSFLRLFKAIDELEVASFASLWVYGTGCPYFQVNCIGIRRNTLLETVMKMINYDHVFALTKSKARVKLSMPMRIRVQETEWPAYYKTIQIKEDIGLYDFPAKSRIRERKKVTEKPQPTEINIVDVNQYPIVPPMRFYRIDPDFQWIRRLEKKQSLNMWLHQLEDDGDVGGQYEAIKVLSQYPEQHAVAALSSVLRNPKVFYRIRCLACEHLGSIPVTDDNRTAALREMGGRVIVDYAQQTMFDADLLPNKNNFSDFGEYYVRLTVVSMLGQVSTHGNADLTRIAYHFLYLALKHNDNTENPFSDSVYIATLLQAITKATAAADNAAKVQKQILRYIIADEQFPSQGHVVTVAGLKALCDLQVRYLIPMDINYFVHYLRPNHPLVIRCAAVECLRQFVTLDFSIVFGLLELARADTHPKVRMYCIENVIALFAGANAVPLLVHARNLNNKTPADSTRLTDLLWKLINEDSAFDPQLKHQAVILHNALFPSARGKLKFISKSKLQNEDSAVSAPAPASSSLMASYVPPPGSTAPYPPLMPSTATATAISNNDNNNNNNSNDISEIVVKRGIPDEEFVWDETPWINPCTDWEEGFWFYFKEDPFRIVFKRKTAAALPQPQSNPRFSMRGAKSEDGGDMEDLMEDVAASTSRASITTTPTSLVRDEDVAMSEAQDTTEQQQPQQPSVPLPPTSVAEVISTSEHHLPTSVVAPLASTTTPAVSSSPSSSVAPPPPPSPPPTSSVAPEVPQQSSVQTIEPEPAPVQPPLPVPIQAPVQPPLPVPIQAPILTPVPIQAPLPTPASIQPPLPVPIQAPLPTPAPMQPPLPAPIQTPLPTPAPIQPVPIQAPIRTPQPIPMAPPPVPIYQLPRALKKYSKLRLLSNGGTMLSKSFKIKDKESKTKLVWIVGGEKSRSSNWDSRSMDKIAHKAKKLKKLLKKMKDAVKKKTETSVPGSVIAESAAASNAESEDSDDDDDDEDDTDNEGDAAKEEEEQVEDDDVDGGNNIDMED